MKKVLIFTETIGGSGHFHAAKSIQKAILTMTSNVEVKLIHGLSLVSRKLEASIRYAYLQTLRVTPKIWGTAYEQEKRLSILFQTPLGQFIALYLRKVIAEERPTVVVCTHAFCLSAVAQLKEEFCFRLGAAITDFDVNGFWLHKSVDFYLVAHEDLRKKIREKGYDADVVSTGIPIDPLFNEVSRMTKQSVRKRLKIEEHKPTILLTGGGMGLGPIDRLIETIRQTFEGAVQIVVLTGHNHLLKEKCTMLYHNEPNVYIYGYVNDCAYHMAASDVLVTKPGGLTSSEALALGLPLIISQPIPGQEERNTRFLLDKKAAILVNDPQNISQLLEPFITNTRYYREFSQAVQKIGKPAAAFHAADVILNST